jgi:hypothetical protein
MVVTMADGDEYRDRAKKDMADKIRRLKEKWNGR